MDEIQKEIDAMAEKMEKAVNDKAFSMDLIKSTILKLGKEKFKKAYDALPQEQKALCLEVLEDMAKSHRELIARDRMQTTEPASNSTPAGDYLFNEEIKPPFTEHDEHVNAEARKKQQMVHRNQGGAPIEGWEGQVIKSDKVKAEAEPTEQKKKEAKCEADEHNKLSPSEEAYEKKIHVKKAEEGAFGQDGDRIAKKQGVPKGVNPEKHEEMVQALKREGHSKQSAYAITNSKLGKGDMKHEDMKKERKRLKKAMRMLKKALKIEKIACRTAVTNPDGSVVLQKGSSPRKEALKAEYKDVRKAYKAMDAACKMESLKKKKAKAKENLHAMMGRMQERKMEKSKCVAALAKSLNAPEDKLGEIWDQIAKGSSEHQEPKVDGFKYDDGKSGTAPTEATQQSRVPEIMKGENEAGVKDPEDPSVPKYKDGSGKKPEGKKKPESGHATETADETISKVPETMGHHGDMKKSDGFWHEEEEVYLAKSQDPFAHRSHGQNVAYKVDAYVELEHVSQETRLKKSTFDYLHDEEELSKGGMGSGRHKEKIETGPIPYKNRDKKPGNLLEKQPMEKGQAEAEAATADQAKEVARQQRQNAKEEKEAQRQAKVDEQLTRIEERAGPKIPGKLQKDFDGSNASEGMMKTRIKKSVVNDIIEKSLDMSDDHAAVAQANLAAEANGAFLVKSFSDDDMDALFSEQDMFKAKDKDDKKKELKKDISVATPAPKTGTAPDAGAVASGMRTAFGG